LVEEALFLGDQPGHTRREPLSRRRQVRLRLQGQAPGAALRHDGQAVHSCTPLNHATPQESDMNRLPNQGPQGPSQPTARITPSAWARTAYATVVLVALASASIATMAQSFVDTDPALYRCAVLGETRSCRQPAPRPDVRYEEWIELGTHAQYLRHLGADADEAIASARARSETPRRHIVQVTRVALSPDVAFARGTGQRVVADELRRTLFVEPAQDDKPLLHNDWSASLLALPSKCPPGGPSLSVPLERCSGLVVRAK
jgi:hypothetical protein